MNNRCYTCVHNCKTCFVYTPLRIEHFSRDFVCVQEISAVGSSCAWFPERESGAGRKETREVENARSLSLRRRAELASVLEILSGRSVGACRRRVCSSDFCFPLLSYPTLRCPILPYSMIFPTFPFFLLSLSAAIYILCPSLFVSLVCSLLLGSFICSHPLCLNSFFSISPLYLSFPPETLASASFIWFIVLHSLHVSILSTARDNQHWYTLIPTMDADGNRDHVYYFSAPIIRSS